MGEKELAVKHNQDDEPLRVTSFQDPFQDSV